MLDRAVRVALVILCAGGPLVVVPGNYDPANLPQSAFVEVGALALLALWLQRAHLQGSFRVPGGPFLLPLLGLLAWTALSLAWARDRYEGVVVLLHWTACAIVFVVAADLLEDEATLRRLATGLFGAGSLVAILGIGQHLFGVSWVPQAFPPAATFVNKNMAAQFGVMVLPFGFVLVSRRPRGLRAGLLVLGGGLLVVFLALTRTRSAWLALIVAAGLAAAPLACLVPAPRRKPALAAVLVVAALALVGLARRGLLGDVMTAYREPTERTSPLPAAALSVQVRLAVWRNTLAMIRDFPLAGVAIGNHPVEYPAYSRRVVVDPLTDAGLQLDYAHNDYLQVGAELGLVGLALLGWAGVALARALRRCARLRRDDPLAWAALAAAASLAAGLVDAFFSFPFYRAVPPLLAAVDAAILTVASSRAVSSKAAGLAPPVTARLAFLAVAIGGLLALALVQARWIRSDRHCLRMFAAERRGDWPRAMAEATAARRLNPYRREPPFVLGTAALALGDLDRAVEALQSVTAKRPYDRAALANLGQAYERRGDGERALACYRRLVAIKPDDAVIQYRMGRLYEGIGDGAAALEAFRLAALHRPGDASFHLRLGMTAMQARLFPEAEEALQRSLALDTRSAAANKALGVVMLETGRADQAVERFRSALSLDPSIRDSAQMRRVIEDYERRAAPRR